jgi:hypothetical protein
MALMVVGANRATPVLPFRSGRRSAARSCRCHGGGHAAQQVARLGQVGVVKAQQADGFAAAQLFSSISVLWPAAWVILSLSVLPSPGNSWTG